MVQELKNTSKCSHCCESHAGYEAHTQAPRFGPGTATLKRCRKKAPMRMPCCPKAPKRHALFKRGVGINLSGPSNKMASLVREKGEESGLDLGLGLLPLFPSTTARLLQLPASSFSSWTSSGCSRAAGGPLQVSSYSLCWNRD